MKSFKTESKRMLELMINSIYTNKEIFLRELISNASDALDKLRFKSLTEAGLPKKFAIEIAADKTIRTLTVSDNGIGMDREELENNLGTIAKSGTYALKTQAVADVAEKSESKKSKKSAAAPAPGELIGQFGVGFYSVFMVAKKVEVVSRRFDAATAYRWVSEGLEGYTVEEAEKNSFGTTVTLTLKDKDEDFDYDRLLDEHYIESLVRKYSDFIRYPVEMNAKTLNSMVPIWKKPKAQVKKEDYEAFYKNNYRDYLPPLKTVCANIEGTVNYNLLVFVPQKAPFDFYSKDFERGLTLYSNSVLIMQRCKELLPDYFAFMRGLVDSGDLSLNISRETLQQDRQLRAIASSLEKKLLSEFKKTLSAERETYEQFFDEFGASFKFGAYDNYGADKEKLQDLLLFKSSFEDKYATLAEYAGRMKEGQDAIFYSSGASVEAAKRVPQVKAAADKGYEVLYLGNPMDEFVVKSMAEYGGKRFVSVTAKDGLPDSDADKERIEQATEQGKDLLAAVKDLLKDEVKDVAFSNAAGGFASCLRAEGEISLEMEKLLASMPGAAPVRIPKILELNPDHPLTGKLKTYFTADKESFDALAVVLLKEAQLLGGIAVEDGAAFIESLNKLLVKE